MANKKDFAQNERGFWTIPLYCIDDSTILNTHYSIPSWIYDKAALTKAGVDTGYVVIWRKERENGKLADDQLIFVPAEENTFIPVDSSYERTMLQYLVEKKINFKKPLLMPIDEVYRPDFILDKQKPNVIIEVAGLMNNIDYVNHLRQKRAHYLDKGYKYLEWDVRKPLKIDI